MSPDDNLASLAASHHGVFSLAQALLLGVSERTIQNRSASGRYVRLQPGVYAVVGSTDSSRRRMVAAASSFPLPAAISHETAAELWR